MSTFSILSVTDTNQLTEFCATLFPCIWALNKRHTAFKQFIHRVLKATQISSTCIIVALYYVQRLRSAYPNMQASTGSEVRLFTTALVLANKYLEDSTFTNKTWSSVSGIPVKELNIMEMEFLSELDFNICIPQAQFYQWVMQCQHLLTFTPTYSYKRTFPPDDFTQPYKKTRPTICKPILSWSSSVSALASSRITNYANYPF
ncbi:unnamed protein product [Rhizopus stolonifer]